MDGKKLVELTRDLDQSVDTGDGLYRLRYAWRNPPRAGRGRGLDGVEDDGLIAAYTDALARTRALFDGWGWKRPPGSDGSADGPILAHVFRTDRLHEGDVPLTIPQEPRLRVYTSQVALRSTIGEPCQERRLQRAAIEAAHEAAHTFTHQFVSPLEVIGGLWQWFDEATAVFVEGEVCSRSLEAQRYGLYWNSCPEFSLTTFGGFGGYFAAWFVRYLVNRFTPAVLLQIWKEGRGGVLGALGAIEHVLRTHYQTKLADVFRDYCCEGYWKPDWAAEVAACFGPRSLTERFVSSGGRGTADPLVPLSCRYYRIDWPPETRSAKVDVVVTGTVNDDETQVGVFSAGPGGTEAPAFFSPAEDNGRRWTGTVARPADGAHTCLVVARVHPPTRHRATSLVTVQVSINS